MTVLIRFSSPLQEQPGVIFSLLKRSYAALVEAEPEIWRAEIESWERADRQVFDNPTTVGACTFLSWAQDELVGFYSFDPRPRPAYGVIGHNCIVPEARERGFGTQQITDILRRFTEYGICCARVSTSSHPFFIPAQRMYRSCGFCEVERVPWDRHPHLEIISFERDCAALRGS